MNVALVTGGTRGIGLAISRKLASEGYHLVLGYHSNDQAALSTKDELSGYGVKVETVAGDIGQAETVDNLFRVIETHFASKLTVLTVLSSPNGTFAKKVVRNIQKWKLKWQL